jgi:hypothetical protein
MNVQDVLTGRAAIPYHPGLRVSRQRLKQFEDRHGIEFDRRSLAYAAEWMKHPDYSLPPPQVTVWRREDTGLWVPLSLAIGFATSSFTDCNFSTGTTPLSHAFDATGIPAMFALVILTGGSTSTVTFNGQNLSKLVSKSPSWTGSTVFELWGLNVAPGDRGNHTLVINLATSTSEVDGLAWGYTGTDTTSPFGNTANTEITSNGSAQDCPAVTIATTGNWVVGTYFSQGGTTTDVSTNRGHLSFSAKARAIDSNGGFSAGAGAGHLQMSNDAGWGVIGLAAELIAAGAAAAFGHECFQPISQPTNHHRPTIVM